MLRFKITFKDGLEEVGRVYSRELSAEDPRVADPIKAAETFQSLIDCEHLLERVTGLRCHVDLVEVQRVPARRRRSSK